MLNNENRVTLHRDLFAVVLKKLGAIWDLIKSKACSPGGFDTLFINMEAISTGGMGF